MNPTLPTPKIWKVNFLWFPLRIEYMRHMYAEVSVMWLADGDASALAPSGEETTNGHAVVISILGQKLLPKNIYMINIYQYTRMGYVYWSNIAGRCFAHKAIC